MVPATLYIMLGVVLLLYNLLLAECQRIDQIESEDAMEIENRKNSDDCEVASLELLSLKEELQATGKKILLLTNNNHRYAAVSNGDFEENDQLAGFGDKRRKSKNNKGVQRCSARCCFVSFHDVNINWIQCDKCDQEFHLMCEVLTSVE